MGYSIIAADDRHRAPQPERDSIDHRADLISHLPARRFTGGQCGSVAVVAVHVEGASGARQHEKGNARPEQVLSGLHGGHRRGKGNHHRARKQRRGILEKRIDQRRVS